MSVHSSAPNIMMVLEQAVNNLSTTQLSDSAVISKTLQIATHVESTVVQEGLDASNAIAESMNTIVTQGYWVHGTTKHGGPAEWTLGTQQCQEEMSYLNTDYSQVSQETSMNQTTVGSLVSGVQTSLQMDMQGLQGLLGMWSTIASALSFFAQLLKS